MSNFNISFYTFKSVLAYLIMIQQELNTVKANILKGHLQVSIP